MELQEQIGNFSAIASSIEVPEDGTLSRTLFENQNIKVVLFAFSANQELSEHTASMPALMHLVSGEAAWGLGTETRHATPGDWTYMPANLPHRISVSDQAVMLLLLLKGMKA